jgi:hypothetical protein
MEFNDVSEIKDLTVIKMTTYMDDHPLKASVHHYLVKSFPDGLRILEHIASEASNYSREMAHPKLTNKWLFDPKHDLEFSSFTEKGHVPYGESSLNQALHCLSIARAFHTSNVFKFDIDGKENTKPGFKFSELKPLSNLEKFEVQGGQLQVIQKYLHQPEPLKIAKFENPVRIELNNGKSVNITHITELGELIYNAKGLKSVDKSLLTSESYKAMIELSGQKMADKIEDFLVGDKAQHRASFLEMNMKKTVGMNM